MTTTTRSPHWPFRIARNADLPEFESLGYIDVMPKDKYLRVRYDDEKKAELEAEAKAENRELSNYIRHLLETHPGRKRVKSEPPKRSKK